MAEYNPSKIIKDGNTYNFRDTTKIPLAGSNQISGSLIPATDNSIDIGSSTNNIKMLYTKGITIDGAQFSPSNYIPRSGGAVITGDALGRNVDDGEFLLCGGTDWSDGSFISLHGRNFNDGANETGIGAGSQRMRMYPSGTWTWSGTAVQITSDQRLKQQISEIDDNLLDAWEDVDLVQFKYNDAVDQKGKDKARLHTGYVVQQIDDACKSHNVDISKYGLYCHEECKEETREVEHDDGTKTVEVVRPASEHYSLRYTEALIVECAYLRKKNKELQEQLDKLSARLDKLDGVQTK